MILNAPGTLPEQYVSQVVNLHAFMAAHWHAILRDMPRQYRPLARALRWALAHLVCRFAGTYRDGCGR